MSKKQHRLAQDVLTGESRRGGHEAIQQGLVANTLRKAQALLADDNSMKPSGLLSIALSTGVVSVEEAAKAMGLQPNQVKARRHDGLDAAKGKLLAQYILEKIQISGDQPSPLAELHRQACNWAKEGCNNGQRLAAFAQAAVDNNVLTPSKVQDFLRVDFGKSVDFDKIQDDLPYDQIRPFAQYILSHTPNT